MSRENPHTKITVNGTLTGTKTYQVKILLTLRELWGTKSVPKDFVVEEEELSPVAGLTVEDGDYALRYSIDNAVSKVNRRVVDGKLKVA